MRNDAEILLKFGLSHPFVDILMSALDPCCPGSLSYGTGKFNGCGTCPPGDDNNTDPPVIGPGTIYVQDTYSIDLSGDGQITDPLTADLRRDIITGGGNNIMTIGPNGVYVPPFVFNPDWIPALDCAAIDVLITPSVNPQNNTVAQSTYNFMLTGCSKIAPPTGFAVSGNTRVSAYGAMEWYVTLTTANAAALPGETVMIYNDTVENLILKDGVYYFSVGRHSVNNVTFNTTIAAGKAEISNVVIKGNVAVNGISNINRATVKVYNTVILGHFNLTNYATWTGGEFLDNTKDFVCSDGSKITDLYAERVINVGATSVNNVYCEYDAIFNPGINYAFFINNTTVDTYVSTVSNVTVNSPNNHAFGVYLLNDTSMVVDGVVAVSDTRTGAYIHMGYATIGSRNIVTNITGRSRTGSGAVVVSNPMEYVGTYPPGPTASLINWNVSSIKGYSEDGAGISLIAGNLKSSYGYSKNFHGFVVGGSEYDTADLGLIDCIGESLMLSGLKAFRDIYITGGIYISHRDSIEFGNPIQLDGFATPVDRNQNYSIVGVTTIATNTSAYAIRNVGSIPLAPRISGCEFTNRYVLTYVPGIDLTGSFGGSTITPRAILVDAYGNQT